MGDTSEQSNLPVSIPGGLINVPRALVPNCLKALDRLIGAAVDIPVALLAQKKAKIDAQTQSYTLVEAAIAKAAATEAGADDVTIQNAVSVLIRSAYRKQVNREAVAESMVDELREANSSKVKENVDPPSSQEGLKEDWLNVFERYAEDASSERMQALWGRVLAGEVRKPGQYSLRTLRFLSEFSQEDAVTFSKFCEAVFGDVAPQNLIDSELNGNIRPLIDLESSGLIRRDSVGLTRTLEFNEHGYTVLREKDYALVLGSGLIARR